MKSSQVCSVQDCTRNIRSGKSPYCECHYYRIRRNGHLELLDRTPPETTTHSHGYILILAHNHPLSNGNTRIYQHRQVYYDKHGAGPFDCHWCNESVTWNDLHIDHLNDCKSDNDPSNLVASCAVCNQARGRHKMIATMQANGIQLTLYSVTQCKAMWARQIGISTAALEFRLKRWDVHKALTTPARRNKTRELRRNRAKHSNQ